VRLLHAPSRVDASFDEPNLVSAAGLLPLMRLAASTGLWRLVRERLRVGGPCGANPAGKIATIVAGMAAGADCIDDLDVVRSGGLRRLFGCVYAPSTLGSFLRALTWGHVRQLESAARAFLAGLTRATPLLPGVEQMAFVDVDSLLRRVYGHAKAGAAHGHAKVGGYPVLLRGLSPLIATVCTPLAAPVVAATRLRGGNAGSARGAAGLVAEAIGVARACGAAGQVLMRADSAFCSTAVLAACRRAQVSFSVTIRLDRTVRAAIASIGETEWTAIRYPQAVWDADGQCWISAAELAETTHTLRAGTRHQLTCRLVVRRVRAIAQPGETELFPAWRYHAFLTDTRLSTVDADLTHRAHAVIEQTFADLIDGPLAHLPSGRFPANAAWLTCAGITHNLLRAAGTLAGGPHAKARGATLRRQLVTVPARTARRARTTVLHLPEHWPWADAWTALFTATHAPPTAA
jgi:Transposase DDE domain group 1